MEKQPSTSNREEKISPAAKAAVLLVRAYQLVISPWLGPGCRHIPSCSAYMIESLREWGAVKGGWLGLKRIARCHPWGTSGYDPVPRKTDSGHRNSGRHDPEQQCSRLRHERGGSFG